MEKRRVIDRRVVKLENVTRPDFIPFLGGRPIRATVISYEDISNLKISLNTSASLEEFLARV